MFGPPSKPPRSRAVLAVSLSLGLFAASTSAFAQESVLLDVPSDATLEEAQASHAFPEGEPLALVATPEGGDSSAAPTPSEQALTQPPTVPPAPTEVSTAPLVVTTTPDATTATAATNDSASDASDASFEALQAFCTEPLILQLRVAGQERGTQFAFVTTEGVWLAQQALAASEAGYASRTQDCEGIAYVLLRPDVVARVDTLALTLDIDPNFALLSSQRASVVPRRQTLSSDASLLRLRYNLGVRANVAESSVGQQGQIGVDYLQGPFHVQATYSQGAATNSAFTQNLSASADVQLGSFASAGVFGQVGGTTGFGVRADFSNEPERFLPPIEVRLPVDANVEVLVDNVTVDVISAQAGRLLVSNLQPKGTSGNVTLRWREGNDLRTLVTPYEYDAPFQAGSINASGSLGLDVDQGLLGQAAASVAVTDNVQLVGGVSASASTGTASVTGVYVDDRMSFSIGGTTRWDDGIVNSSLTGRASSSIGNLGVTVAGTYSLTNAARSTLGLDATTSLGEVKVGAGVAYRFDNSLSSRVSLAWNPSTSTSLGAFAELGTNSSVRVGLQGRVVLQRTPDSTLSATAGTSSDANTLVRGSLDYNLKVNATDSLSVSYGPPTSLSAGYTFNRVVSGAVNVNSNGQVSANVRGGVAFVGGRVSATTDAQGSALLLKTGVPGINIYSGGQLVGTTNQRGELIVTGLGVNSAQVSVNLDDLPIEVGVRTSTLSLAFDREGVYTYDWSSNFELSRFLTLRWSTGEIAKYGILDLPGGQTVYADAEGVVLLPITKEPVRGLLRDENGTRRCSVVVSATGDVTCGD